MGGRVGRLFYIGLILRGCFTRVIGLTIMSSTRLPLVLVSDPFRGVIIKFGRWVFSQDRFPKVWQRRRFPPSTVAQFLWFEIPSF